MSEGGKLVERFMQVRLNDADALGHINNAIYLTYLETARSGMIEEALGQDAWWDWIAAHVSIDYLHEIPVTQKEVKVTCRALRIGNSSIRTRDEALLPDGTVAARAEAVIVVRDRSTGKSRPLTDAEKQAFSAYLYTVDDGITVGRR